MTNRVAVRLARNPRLAVILLVTLGLRALTPIGYMPGPGGLMLCPGYAPIASTTDADRSDMSGMDMSGMDMSGPAMPMGAVPMDHSGKAPSHDGMGMCPFAAAATAFTLFHAPAIAAFVPVVRFEIASEPRSFNPPAQVPPTRLPRGPPASVLSA